MRLQQVIARTLMIVSVISGLGVVATAFNPSHATDCSNTPVVVDGTDSGPVSTACDTTISANLSKSISVDSMSFSQEGLASVVPGGSVKTGTLTVGTSSNTPYSLGFAMVNTTYDDYTYTQAPNLEFKQNSTTYTLAAGTPTVESSAWGVKIGSKGTASLDCTSSYCSLSKATTSSSTAQTKTQAESEGFKILYSTNSANPGSETHTLTVGASASSSQVAGTYKGVIQAIAVDNT